MKGWEFEVNKEIVIVAGISYLFGWAFKGLGLLLLILAGVLIWKSR